MFQKKQKIFLILASFLLVFICFSFVYALEGEYPEAGGVKPDETTTLPQYIVYLFNFSIAIAGIVAFGVIVWSGIKILTSPDDPETRKDAKTKIIGALLGIIILLSSYLILTTINPQWIMIGLGEPLKPVTGIYLINSKGEKEYITQDAPKITFDANLLEFLSTKDELLSVFIYGGELYQGTETEVPNPKVSSSSTVQSSIPTPKSIALIWNRPGVYLYPKTNYESRPRFFNGSVMNLSDYDFDKKAKSLEFIDGPNVKYGIIMFTEPGERGSCGLFWNFKIPDLGVADSANYQYSIGAGGLSSFRLFNWAAGTASSVTVFDAPNCTGHGLQISSPSGVTSRAKLSPEKYGDEKTIKDNIISFSVIGKVGVLLTTQEDFKGKCQFFTIPSGENNCYPSIESTYLWEITHLFGPSVGSIAIFPLK